MRIQLVDRDKHIDLEFGSVAILVDIFDNFESHPPPWAARRASRARALTCFVARALLPIMVMVMPKIKTRIKLKVKLSYTICSVQIMLKISKPMAFLYFEHSAEGALTEQRHHLVCAEIKASIIGEWEGSKEGGTGWRSEKALETERE